MEKQPRTLLAAADLHFGLYPEGDASTLKLAEHVCASDADVLVIVGDVADEAVGGFASCLRLFKGFRGLKLLVPGNHDLWTKSGDSERRYRSHLPRLATQWGFHMLDRAPIRAGTTGFIGNIGWYDYSFRNPDLEIPREVYRHKLLPGVCSWNDGIYIRWDMTDEEFTERCLRRLRRHYGAAEPKVERVIAVLHHVPFAELLYGPSGRAAEFCRAFMGSARFGELLVRCPKVRFVICGHQHRPAACERGELKAFVVGSEYKMKRLLRLDIATGEYDRMDF